MAAIVVAIAFNPLRLLIMKLVDRAFYGTRSDPATTASGVGQRLRDDGDLGDALERTRVALRLPGLSLRRPDGTLVGVAGTVEAGPVIELPLTFRGTVVGTLQVGLRRGEGVLHADDRRTLELIGTPLAAALHAATLREQVQVARTATVEAAAAERVRLQRELHDGLGPVLTSLSFTADAASNLVRTDPAEAERMLADVRGELRTALDEVRRVVYGLRPIELDDLGLAGALRQKVAAMATTMRSGPEIRLWLPDDLPPLSAAVELAAYRIVLEALANLIRHSAAEHCDVRVTAGEQLVITIDDDGPPPPEWSAGVGLRSIVDRAEELGGSATAGPADSGWRVRAELPLVREATVHSVEHHRGFGEMMAAELGQFEHVTLRVVEPAISERPVVASAKEGHGGLDFADYVAAIDAVQGNFDLIVVDGRAREACLRAAQCRLSPGGIVVFDNSRRRRYREAIRASGMLERRFAGLTPTLPYPEQTSLLRAP